MSLDGEYYWVENEENELRSIDAAVVDNSIHNNETNNRFSLVRFIFSKNFLKLAFIFIILLSLNMIISYTVEDNCKHFLILDSFSILEQGETAIENYFNNLDKMFVNIKSSPRDVIRGLYEYEGLFYPNLQNKEEIIPNATDESILSKIELDSKDIQEFNNNTSSESGDKSTEYDFKYYKTYEFIKNITYYGYKGKWNDLQITNNTFNNEQGIVDLDILKNFSFSTNRNYISNIESIEALYFYMIIKDGEYRDNVLVANFSMTLPQNFSNEFEGHRDRVRFSNENVNLKYYQQEIFGSSEQVSCNKTSISLEFVRDPKILRANLDHINIIEYSKLNIQIRDHTCKFGVDFTLNVNDSEDYSERIWNYSLITTVIVIFEIYFTLKLLNEVAENNQVGKNLCLITLSMNIIWNSFLCSIHFYLSMTNEESSYEYGTPSMMYFLLFAFFELRLLFFAWKSRYVHLLYENNQNEYRKKLLRFYTLFYVCLFFNLLFMRHFFINFWTCLIFFSATWVFQIIHSSISGTKPPFSRKYIFMTSLGKLFGPLYIKACPYNLFELSPSYLKVCLICIVILIEIGILAIQKYVSAKFFVPGFLKKKPYNFYRDLTEDEIKSNHYNSECIICLEILTLKSESNEPSNVVIDAATNRNLFFVFSKITTKINLWVESLKHTYSKKCFMVTPCNHIFHTSCFERWLEMKNECPYCRQQVPPLE